MPQRVFFSFTCTPTLRCSAHRQHGITALVLFLWLWMPTFYSRREWWLISWDSTYNIAGISWRISPSSLWIAHMKLCVIRILIIERMVKCLLDSEWKPEIILISNLYCSQFLHWRWVVSMFSPSYCFWLFCNLWPTKCLGPLHYFCRYVFTLYLVGCILWQPCLFNS